MSVIDIELWDAGLLHVFTFHYLAEKSLFFWRERNFQEKLQKFLHFFDFNFTIFKKT